MPAGLDGNPRPIITPERSRLLDRLVAEIRAEATPPTRRVLVGVDGASGTGKSTMADELAARVAAGGPSVLRATVDSFHRPRAERYRRGTDSASGYYRDSHDLGALISGLLDPFAAGSPTVCLAVFDEPTDSPVEGAVHDVPTEAVLVFDGLFLHRPELVARWHLSLFLVADRRRKAAWDAHWTGRDPALAERRRHRYFDGQALYEAEARPTERATFVVDNDDLAIPTLAP